MTWTRFHDMHSGGGLKEKWACIYIEAPEAEARVVFYNRFGHNPERVTCTCCGEDYSISEGESLAQLTGYDRGCHSLVTPRDDRGLYKQPNDAWWKAHYYVEPEDEAEAIARGWEVNTRHRFRDHIPLDQYLTQADVLVIHANDIKPEERVGDVPEQGYVWRD